MGKALFFGLTRLALPASLLFAGLVQFSAFSAVYFLAFLGFQYLERHGHAAEFPVRSTVLLVVYSLAEIITQGVLVGLISRGIIPESRFSLLNALGIARFDISVWEGIRPFLGAVAVLLVGFVSTGYFSTQGLFTPKNFFKPLKPRADRGLVRKKSSVRIPSDSRPKVLGMRREDTISSTNALSPSAHRQYEITNLTEQQQTSTSVSTPSKFNFFMAKRGGAAWFLAALLVAGMAYSSVLTLLHNIFAFAAFIVWSMQFAPLQPRNSPTAIIFVINLVRILLVVQLVFIYILNIEGILERTRNNPYCHLLGAIELTTSQSGNWAPFLAFGASVTAFVLAGLYEAAIRAVYLDFGGCTRSMEQKLRDTGTETHTLRTAAFIAAKASLALGATGFLIWSVVFPGILTAPLLAYTIIKLVFAPRIPVVLNQISAIFAVFIYAFSFMYGAVSGAFSELDNSDVMELLGFRQIDPNFGNNSIQAMALVFLSISSFFERWMVNMKVTCRESSISVVESASTWSILRKCVRSKFYLHALYPLRMVLDQAALIVLFLLGNSKSSLLNGIFIVGMIALCLTEGVVSRYSDVFVSRRRLSQGLWSFVLAYTVFYLGLIAFGCRIPHAVTCDLPRVGFYSLTEIQVLLTSLLFLLASAQVHFTWNGGVEMPHLYLYKTPFWVWLRNNSRLLVYIVATIVPLSVPANFLSYGYIAFLGTCFAVEVTLNSSKRTKYILPRLFNVGNVFAVAALLARYISGFEDTIYISDFAKESIFGFGRGLSNLELSLGDGMLVIVLSFQGFVFSVDDYVTSREGQAEPNDGIDRFDHEDSKRIVVTDLTDPELAFVREKLLRPVHQTTEAIRKLWRIGRSRLRRLLFNYSFAGTTTTILISSIWLDGISVFGLLYTLFGVAGVFLDGRVRVGTRNDGERVAIYSHSMRLLSPILVLMSFGFLTIQQLFSVLVLTDETLTENKYARYVGLRPGDREGIPLGNSAVLAHALVLLAAFLERATMKWAAATWSDLKPGQLHSDDEETLADRSLPNHDDDFGRDNDNLIIDQKTPAPPVSADFRVPTDCSLSGFADRKNAVSLQEVVTSFDVRKVESLSSNDIERLIDSIPIGEALGTSELTQQEQPSQADYPNEQMEYDNAVGSADSSRSSINMELDIVIDEDSMEDELITLEDHERRDCDVTNTHDEELITADGIYDADLQVQFEADEKRIVSQSVDAAKDVFWVFPMKFLRTTAILVWTCISLLFPFWVLLGFETTFFVLLIGAVASNSVFTAVYAGMVASTYLMPRNRLESFWIVWTAVLSVIYMVQYSLALGLPEGVQSTSGLDPSLAEYLYIDGENVSPSRKWNLTVGYIGVICAGLTLSNLPRRKFDILRSSFGQVPNFLLDAVSEAESAASEEDVEEDFTRSPLATKDLIVLWSMRFSSIIVQIFILVAASSTTTAFTTILLVTSFVFFVQVSNIPTKTRSFLFLRIYVVVALGIIILYQIPVISLPEGWENSAGLHKLSSATKGRALVSVLIALWLFTQLQARMFETKRFRFVVDYVEAEESFRFRRAIHSHQSMLFGRMLKQNKITRDSNARGGRLAKIQGMLREGSNLPDALWESCVKDSRKVLEEEISAEDYLVDRLRKTSGPEQTLPWWNRLIRYMYRGSSWALHRQTSLWRETQAHFSKHSSWAVYFTIVVSAVLSPSWFTVLNVLVLFLYLVQEQPRPAPAVWTALILYNMLVVLIKFVLRWPGWGFETPPYAASGCESGLKSLQPCAIGPGIIYNVLILLAIFWHRMALYYRGLWDMSTSEEDLRVRYQVIGRAIEEPTPDVGDVAEKWHLSASDQLGLCEHLLVDDTDAEDSDDAHSTNENRSSHTAEDDLRAELKGSIRKSGRRSSRFHLRATSLKSPTSPRRAPKPRPLTSPYDTQLEDESKRRTTVARFVRSSRVQPPHGGAAASESDSDDENDSSSQLADVSSRGNAFFDPVLRHFKRLLREIPYEAVGDYYMWMFLADFAGLIYMIFGFPFMFNDPSGVGRTNTWWNSNFIDLRHLFTLMALYMLIIIDRIIYFRRSLLSKIILQYVSVIAYHIILFGVAEIGTRTTVKIFYLFKCVSFFVSAVQIRSGYPKYTVGQRLMRNFNMTGFFVFLGYYNIPFLWLCRTLLDWAFMKTSLELTQFFKFNDIYIHLYINRAVNTFRGKFRRVRGQPRPMIVRLFQGALLFLLLSILIFSPFILFSAINPFFESRSLSGTEMTVNLRVDGSLFPLYRRFTVNAEPIGGEEVQKFAARYNIMEDEIAERSKSYVVNFDSFSQNAFLLSFPDLERLPRLLNEGSSVQLLQQIVASSSRLRSFSATSVTDLDASQRANLASALVNQNAIAIPLPNGIGRALELSSADELFEVVDVGNNGLCLLYQSAESSRGLESWWSLVDCDVNNCDCNGLGPTSVGETGYLLSVADVSSISFGGGTIIAVFAVILFTVANLARSVFVNKRLLMPYTDAPFTLHLYQIVYDILHSRQDGDLETEEILFWGLTEIYRDPHKLALWTGQRQVTPADPWWSDEQQSWPSHIQTETEPYLRRRLE